MSSDHEGTVPLGWNGNGPDDRIWVIAPNYVAAPPRPEVAERRPRHICEKCGLACWSLHGLRRHTRAKHA